MAVFSGIFTTFLFWYPPPFSVSCLGIPVPGFHHIFVVIIFSLFLSKKTLLLHISKILLLFENRYYLSSSCSRDTWNHHPFYICICDCFPVNVKQMSFQVFSPFEHYLWISIIFGSSLNEALYSFYCTNFYIIHLWYVSSVASLFPWLSVDVP